MSSKYLFSSMTADLKQVIVQQQHLYHRMLQLVLKMKKKNLFHQNLIFLISEKKDISPCKLASRLTNPMDANVSNCAE